MYSIQHIEGVSSILNESSSIDHLQADELCSVLLYYGVLFWVHHENEYHNMGEEGEFVIDGLFGRVHRGLVIQICQYMMLLAIRRDISKTCGTKSRALNWTACPWKAALNKHLVSGAMKNGNM